MIKRYGQKAALRSFIKPAIIYLSIATALLWIFHDYLFELKNGTLATIAAVGIWRYGLLVLNILRAIVYSKVVYPKYRKRISSLPYQERFPDTVYFIIPSYKEDPWVTTEVFQSLITDINSIPSQAVLLISTATDFEDSVIRNVFDAHPNTEKIKIIFQKQDSGKRIAMGHSLRALSREYYQRAEDPNSVCIFMDGDTYIPVGTLEASLPFFKIEKNLGALTTNEIAFIDSESNWYKDWFNLKFAQRHLLFQSHSISKRVLTLTGRFSMFRAKVVIEEEFISLIENDIIIDPNYGKFRFLMGDDKSSWYHMMKNNWDMLYLPDVIAYSLESRDGNFLEISKSLPYRWYGNTLRNNKRARALKNQPIFIKYLFYDQLALMWTSIVGVLAVILLSIFKSIFYIPLYISWIIYVRTMQMSMFVYFGHKVSLKTLPLMLYGQWYGAFVKIRAFYNLSDQKWSKASGEVQSADDDIDPIKYKFFKYYAPFRMYLFSTLFFFFLLTKYTNILTFPTVNLFAQEVKKSNYIYFKGVSNDSKDDAEALNKLIKNVPDYSTIILPKGRLDIFEPIIIKRSNIKLIGSNTELLSHMKNSEKAIISIEGEKSHYLGKTLSDIEGKSRITVSVKENLKKGDLLLIEQPNDSKYVKDLLGSKRWYKQYPTLRSEIIEVSNYTNNEILMQFPSSSLINKGATIFKIDPISNIVIKNLTLNSIYSSKNYEHIYKNSKKNLFIDGINMKYVSKIHLENIKIYNSGSSPLVLERAYNCYLNNISIDGAINKGKKGNGYLRVNKSFHNKLYNISVKNIRHIVFQWSSAYNTIKNLYTEVDINFHGGSSHDNRVEDVIFNVNLKKHKWKEIYRTPDNASWAPPDLRNNIVKRITK